MVMNFDLEDGQAPVSFSLKPADAERFIAFMAECEAARKATKVGSRAGWVCTDMDGSAAIGFTKEQAKRGASPACDEFLPVYFAAPTSA